jgi:hypothetical protein
MITPVENLHDDACTRLAKNRGSLTSVIVTKVAGGFLDLDGGSNGLDHERLHIDCVLVLSEDECLFV